VLVVAVFIETKRDQGAAMREALIAHAAKCRSLEPGCRRYDVAQDPVEPGAFFLFQVYESEAAYLAHREFPHYAEFRLKVDTWTEARRVLTYELLTGGEEA
jgi:(4S)-4-hydroxy-5-phosphonooxypentane-2,3-dione isomerase